MTIEIKIQTLTPPLFAPFGEVIEAEGAADLVINRGMCGRFHDLAQMEFGPEGRPGISLFKAEPYRLPLTLEMVERHPLGSQAFIPMQKEPFLVIVAKDAGGEPAMPMAFLTNPGQGINYRRGVWHGVLTPLGTAGLFAVIDRIGPGDNLQEHWFDVPPNVRANDSR